MDYKKEIGKRIQAAREEKGWTLDQLEAKTGLASRRISNYETGYRLPKPQELVTLASAMGKRPAFLACLDDSQLPISPLEEKMVRNWRALPERDRMSFFRKLDQLAMTYRDPVSDQTVERSLGRPDKKRRKVTSPGGMSPNGDD